MTTQFHPPLDLAADVFRRRIEVREIATGLVIAELCDDFHHFVVTLRHDGAAVTAVDAESIRWPWSTCPGAAEPLRALAGMPLAARFTAAAAWAPPAHNCTHQFDAAAHAITHATARLAGTRPALRQYDCEVGAHFGRPRDAVGRNRLWVDGVLELSWQLAPGRGPVAPEPPFDAAPWRGGFMRWADATLEPEAAERAIVLRRACDIGMGRGMPLDDIPVASDLLATMGSVCHTMQPDIAVRAPRNVGNIRDFSGHPDQLGGSAKDR